MEACIHTLGSENNDSKLKCFIKILRWCQKSLPVTPPHTLTELSFLVFLYFTSQIQVHIYKVLIRRGISQIIISGILCQYIHSLQINSCECNSYDLKWNNSSVTWSLSIWSAVAILGPPYLPREFHLYIKSKMTNWFCPPWWWRFSLLQYFKSYR